MGVEIQLFEVGAYRSDFCLWGWMKNEVYREKVNTRDELVVHIMNSAALIKQERQDDMRRATLTRELKSALKLMVGFFNTLTRCNLLRSFTEPVNAIISHLSFLHTLVRLFMRNNQTAVSPHPLKIGHMFI
jgi:hypothetical protein